MQKKYKANENKYKNAFITLTADILNYLGMEKEASIKRFLTSLPEKYKVAEGDTLFVEKLNAEEGSAVTFDQVLMVGEGDSVTVGAPVVDGAKVEAKVVKNGKAKKIYVFKMKRKKNERTKKGHRQPYTKIEITKINA